MLVAQHVAPEHVQWLPAFTLGRHLHGLLPAAEVNTVTRAPALCLLSCLEFDDEFT